MERAVDEREVADYCRHHPLSRPKVGILYSCAMFFLVEGGICMASWLVHQWVGLSFMLCMDILTVIAFLLLGKPVGKTLVKLYQRYASEATRRQCSCMPSCSEYALLALEKYPWPKAYYMIWRRITHTCVQPGYHADYP